MQTRRKEGCHVEKECGESRLRTTSAASSNSIGLNECLGIKRIGHLA